MKSLSLIFAVAFFLLSCKDTPVNPPIPTSNISGTWQGTGVKSGIKFTVTVDLMQTDNDTTITGSGNISALIVTIPFFVTGGNVYPDVRMTFNNPDPAFGSGVYVGKFDSENDNIINGVATVPAFGIADEPLKMERK